MERTEQQFNEAVRDFEKQIALLDWFEFREHQKETIIQLANNMYFGTTNKVQILDAPTGSGKSVIAFGVAMILNACDLKGYIITSDLELQRQYERDVLKFDTGFESLQGKDNYNCNVNYQPISQADCVGHGRGKIRKLKCYNTCTYFKKYERARKSETTIFNYKIWLLYVNHVIPRSEQPPFTKRDFVIFDEGHTIDEIVLSSYAPTISQIHILYGRVLTFLINVLGMDFDDFEFKIEDCYNSLIKESNNDEIVCLLQEMIEYLKPICGEVATLGIPKMLNEKYPVALGVKKPKSILKSFHQWEKLTRLFSPIEEFLNYVTKSDDTNFVKNVSDNGVITIKPLKTYGLCKKYLFDQAERSMVMSATFGQHEKYQEISGIESSDITVLSNTFNYKKSPIINVIDGVSMAYRNLDKGIISNTESVKRILRCYPTKKGLIHTGTYNIMFKMCAILEKDEEFKGRLFYYETAKDKEQVVENFKNSDNGVLIGPSLIEGISLDDDLSRFQIIMKVPYLSLGDDYIKIKSDQDSEWYQWKTALKLLQGIGRSIRNKDDYAMTYILDKDFGTKFYKYSKAFLSDMFLERYMSLSLNSLEKLYQIKLSRMKNLLNKVKQNEKLR